MMNFPLPQWFPTIRQTTEANRQPQQPRPTNGFGSNTTDSNKQPPMGQQDATKQPGNIQGLMDPFTLKMPDWMSRVNEYRPQRQWATAWMGIDPKRRNDMLGWQPFFREAYLEALSNPDKRYEVRDTPDQASYFITGKEYAERIWRDAASEMTQRRQREIEAQRQKEAQQEAMRRQRDYGDPLGFNPFPSFIK